MRTVSSVVSIPLAVACLFALSACGADSAVTSAQPSASTLTTFELPVSSTQSAVESALPPEETDTTVDPTDSTQESTSPAVVADPADYSANIPDAPLYGFVSPSQKWLCAIQSVGPRAVCASNPAQGPIGIAGAPARVPGPEGSTVTATVIEVSAGADPDFGGSSQTICNTAAGSATVLPYNTTLTAGGFSCNVQTAGISCRDDSTGKGFTFSDAGYSFEYTPVA